MRTLYVRNGDFLQDEFYGILAYTTVKGSRWSLVCGVTIRPVIIEILIATTSRKVILRSVALFFENHNLTPSLYSYGGEKEHP